MSRFQEEPISTPFATHIALKISKNIGLIAKLRHFVPTQTLLLIYSSLIQPFLGDVIVVWVQASNTQLIKLLKFQKRALRFIYFKTKTEHAIPLFNKANVLPIDILYIMSLSNLMHDVPNKVAPVNITSLFSNVSQIHRYSTRSSSMNNFHIKTSRLQIQKKFIFKFWC